MVALGFHVDHDSGRRSRLYHRTGNGRELTEMNDKAGAQGKGSESGVIKVVGSTQLPQEFITIGKTFEEALGRAVLRDDKQKNAVILYKAQLEMFDLEDEIQDLTNWLNASAAVGGYNRLQAIMAHVGIVIPEAAGVKLSKQGSKEFIEAHRRQQYQNDRENQERTNKE